MRIRSINSYQIKEKEHSNFLLEDRNDPVTGDCFLEGDEIVFCSVCKSAFLKDSWEYMGAKHCDQRFTLPTFPKSKKWILQKPIELPFAFVSTDLRSAAFFMDIFILIFLCISITTFDVKLDLNIKTEFYFILFFSLFNFRDSILINKSIGKRIKGLYFIDVKTNLPATIWQTLGRNLLYWVMNGILAVLIFSARELEEAKEGIIFFLGLAVFVINMLYVKDNIEKNHSWFDQLLGIRLVKKKENKGIL